MDLPPDKQRWTDIAFTVGLTDEDAEAAYVHFGANGWKRANGLPIQSWDQVPFLLTCWRNNGHKFAKESKETPEEKVERYKREGLL